MNFVDFFDRSVAPEYFSRFGMPNNASAFVNEMPKSKELDASTRTKTRAHPLGRSKWS